MSKLAFLAAGTLVASTLCSVSAMSAPIDLTTLTLNGNASATSNDLNLGDNNGGEAASAFLATPYSSNSLISGSFSFTLNDGSISSVGAQADGIAFVIHNDPAGANAIGTGGGDVGAGNIQNGVSIAFQSWYNDHATIFLTNSDSAYGGTGAAGNFSLGQNAANDVTVTFNYFPGLLSFTATNSDTLQTVSESLAVNLGSLGPNVFIGFTGGTGLGFAYQDVSNFNLSVSTVPEPSTWFMMLLGFGGLAFVGHRRNLNRRAASSAA
jgi:hypothetical protein